MSTDVNTKISVKPTQRVVSVSDLVINTDTNVRFVNNYDLPTLKQQIVDAGRILKPIVVEETAKGLEVLQGFRRGLAGKELLAAGDTPQDVIEALKKVPVTVYKGLTAAERTMLINDHGGERPISRSEVLVAVWRMEREGFTEREIIHTLAYPLARFTENLKKWREIEPLTGRARSDALFDWLHGTVGNYMLAGTKMGARVKKSMLYTEKDRDGIITDEERTEWTGTLISLSRDRLKKLSQAKTEDGKADGWDGDTGGKTFNEAWDKFRAEDADPSLKNQGKTKRRSAEELKTLATAFGSPLAQGMLLLAAGEKVEGLGDLDEKIARVDKVCTALAGVMNDITDERVKVLIAKIIHGSPVEVTAFVKEHFCGSRPEDNGSVGARQGTTVNA